MTGQFRRLKWTRHPAAANPMFLSWSIEGVNADGGGLLKNSVVEAEVMQEKAGFQPQMQ